MFNRRLGIGLVVFSLLFMIAFLSLSYSQAPAAANSTSRGDINEDGNVNIFDLLGMLNMLSNPEGKTERARNIADMDESESVNIFDLLSLLQVLSGAEEPGVIYWGPAITGISSPSAAVGDTLVIFVINIDENITANQCSSLIGDTESGITEFSQDSITVVMPEEFAGGEISLIVGSDTTNSISIGLLIKYTGGVEQISGLDLTSLSVVSLQSEDAVEADGSFEATVTDSTTATFVVAVNQAGNPVLLSFMAVTDGAELASVKKKAGGVEFAAVDQLSLGTQSTALSLIMMNPILFGSSSEERSLFAERALQYLRFPELVTQITTILTDDPNSNYLVDESHPELFVLANEIADTVYSELIVEEGPELAGWLDRDPPGIQAGANGNIEFVNPYYVYLGTGIFDYNSDNLQETITQKPRPLSLWRWKNRPYWGVDGITEESITPGEQLTVVINKGFEWDSEYLFNFYHPIGRGTLYNSGRIVVDVVDLLIVKVPHAEEKINLVLGIFEDKNALDQVIEGFENEDSKEVISGFLDVIDRHKTEIVAALFGSAKQDKLKKFVGIVGSVAGSVFKVATAVSKVPFYIDLFAAPDASYNFVLQGGQITPIVPTPGDTTVVSGITMVSIPGGTIQMGTEDTDYSWLEHSRPVHSVILSAFQMAQTEITQAQYESVIGSNPSYWTGDDARPVEQVSWYDAVTFCNKLSEAAGLEPCYDLSTRECDYTKNGFRLPTEAEWEYACRAGTTTKYYTGDSESVLDRAGWYRSNSGSITHAAGGKEANAY
ncbi:SUMF1/EgtB/PvdO family nonheme iron enzyme, partial [Gemmatimonadota bacterium]